MEKDKVSPLPSVPEQLLVQKLNGFENLLETLVKRLDGDASQNSETPRADPESLHPLTAETVRNSVRLGNKTPKRAHLMNDGDRPVGERENESSDDRVMNVKFQIPFHTAEVTLRFENRDVEENQRSALKQAKSSLNRARQNIVTMKNIIQIQFENPEESKNPILMKLNDITNDAFTNIEETSKKWGECQVGNWADSKSVYFLRTLQNETTPEKKPNMQIEEVTVKADAMVNATPFWSKLFLFFVTLCLGYSSCFV